METPGAQKGAEPPPCPPTPFARRPVEALADHDLLALVREAPVLRVVSF
eukprot:COSAG01_NODE_75825_length_192_cov_94.935484_1_plen_48_part_01